MGAADVDDRSENGDLVNEEKFPSWRPTWPSSQDCLHEFDHSYEVFVLRPERPMLMLVDGFVDGEIGGVEKPEEGAPLYSSRRHQVLEPHSMWTRWQGKVSATRSQNCLIRKTMTHFGGGVS